MNLLAWSEQVRVLHDSQSSTLGYWFGALAAVTVAALFATADAVLLPISPARLAVLLSEATKRNRRAFERFVQDPDRVLTNWLVARLVATALASVLLLMAMRAHSLVMALVVSVLTAAAGAGVLAQVGTVLARHWLPKSAVFLVRMLRPLEVITLPLSLPLYMALRGLGKVVPRSQADSKMREHEVGLLLEEGQRDGSIELERVQMMRNVLEFEDLMASEVMVPRTLMTAIDADTKLQQVLEITSEKGHSRYPVYRDSIDNVVGLLYAKDLFRVIGRKDFAEKKVHTLMRTPVNFVPETKPVSVLLREMRARRLHLAVVVDDYGGVSGIVTLEDIIEEIVGDIQDEHDKEQDRIELLQDGSALVDAAIPIADLSEYLGVELPEEGDFVSLGGWMIHRAGSVPEPGASLQECGLTFVVRQADERRVIKVQICSGPETTEKETNSDYPDADR